MSEISLQIEYDNIINTEDYTQSANALFHFMKRRTFLESALAQKALFPRFCREDIEYLDLRIGKNIFNEIAVLQKCFCDIPLHMIAKNFELDVSKEYENQITDNEKNKFLLNNNHPGYYGRFALAFSKKWCETKNLQPVHYLNTDSSYTKSLKALVCSATNRDTLDDEIFTDILQRLSLIKPLRGKMKRKLEDCNVEIEVQKNFHDEREWRYIPDIEKILKFNKKSTYKIESVIANPNLLNRLVSPGETHLDYQSKEFQRSEHDFLWLKFQYSDIRYIIVPDRSSRLDIINHIISLPTENFLYEESETEEKYILISKILLLEEIRKDW